MFSLVSQLKDLARDNYNSWGSVIIECYDDSDILSLIEEHGGVKNTALWLKRVQDARNERKRGY